MTNPSLIEAPPRGFCDWSKTDKWGEAYPCGKPAWKRLINATEVWGGVDGGDFCRYHAPRALNRVRAEIEADAASI